MVRLRHRALPLVVALGLVGLVALSQFAFADGRGKVRYCDFCRITARTAVTDGVLGPKVFNQLNTTNKARVAVFEETKSGATVFRVEGKGPGYADLNHEKVKSTAFCANDSGHPITARCLYARFPNKRVPVSRSESTGPATQRHSKGGRCLAASGSVRGRWWRLRFCTAGGRAAVESVRYATVRGFGKRLAVIGFAPAGRARVTVNGQRVKVRGGEFSRTY